MRSESCKFPVRYSPLTNRLLVSPSFHLRGRLRHQFVHFHPNLRFGDGSVFASEIAGHLADHFGVTGFLELGGDHFLGIGTGGVA
jgi:hypothetical protein